MIELDTTATASNGLFIPDPVQAPKKYRRYHQKYTVRQPEYPRSAYRLREEEERDPLIRVLTRIEKILDRGYIDQDYALSNTQSTLFLDYKGRKHLYLFSPVALTLNLHEMGTLAVPANDWTEISFRETVQIFTTNQVNPVFVTVRATDEVMASASLAVNNTITTLPQNTTQILTFSTNAPGDLIPQLDVSLYKAISVQFTGTWSGTINFFGNNTGHNADDYPKEMLALDATYSNRAPVLNTTFGAVYYAPVNHKFFHVTANPLSSGTVIASLFLSTLENPLTFLGVTTILGSSQNYIGLTGNDGTFNGHIAAGITTDTILRGQSGRLTATLVIASGTNQMTFFDATQANPINAGALPLGIIPANAAAGDFRLFRTPAGHSITAQGNANNPEVAVFWGL